MRRRHRRDSSLVSAASDGDLPQKDDGPCGLADGQNVSQRHLGRLVDKEHVDAACGVGSRPKRLRLKIGFLSDADGVATP
jgi:hypothetical protein